MKGTQASKLTIMTYVPYVDWSMDKETQEYSVTIREA